MTVALDVLVGGQRVVSPREFEMNSSTRSLHRVVDKWLAPTPATPARVVRLWHGDDRLKGCVRVEVCRPAGVFSVLFFRHSDGSWCVFPPPKSRPSMAACLFKN